MVVSPSAQVHNLQELRRSASLATKIFIQRDYSDGTICQFQTKFPPELDGRVRTPVSKLGTQAGMDLRGLFKYFFPRIKVVSDTSLIQPLHTEELKKTFFTRSCCRLIESQRRRNLSF